MWQAKPPLIPSALVLRNFAASPLLTASSELVVDLFFKEIHGFSGDVLQEAQELVSAEEAVEALVALAVVLCPAQDALTFSVHFLEMSQVSKLPACPTYPMSSSRVLRTS